MATLDSLREAGQRCENYMIQYGVTLEWTIRSGGLYLKGDFGADKCEKVLYYSDTDAVLLGQHMFQLEQQVLRGLSN